MSWRVPVTRSALLLMEALWIYALVAFVVAAFGEGGKPTLLGVSAVVFASFALSRVLQSSDLSLGVLRAWGSLLSLLIFYAIVRVDFFGDWRLWDFHWADNLLQHTEATLRGRVAATVGIPLMWAFWMRGILRGQQHIAFDDVLSSFGVGVFIVAIVELLHSSVDAPGAVGLIPVPYVALGLIAISLAHAARADEESGRSFGTTWLVAVAGAIVFLGGLALLIALFDLGSATSGLRTAGDAAARVLNDAAYYIFWPVLKLMDWGFAATRWFLNLILGTPQPQPPQVQPTGNDCVNSLTQAGLTLEQAVKQCAQSNSVRELPGWTEWLIRLLIATPIVAAVIAATAILFRRFRRRLRPAEAKESTYTEGRLAADLSGFLGSLVSRLRPNLRLHRDRLDPVRRLYFDVIEAGEHRGAKRRDDQTPLEFAPRLDQTFAAPTPGRVTDAFVDRRYGGHVAPAEDVRRLRDEWEALRDHRT